MVLLCFLLRGATIRWALSAFLGLILPYSWTQAEINSLMPHLSSSAIWDFQLLILYGHRVENLVYNKVIIYKIIHFLQFGSKLNHFQSIICNSSSIIIREIIKLFRRFPISTLSYSLKFLPIASRNSSAVP